MHKVSVIIPTYNRCQLLERAVRSVLAQTYRDFEIIVVDDASTDNTGTVLQEKFKQEIDSGTLGYVRNEMNLERSRSRNKGMEMAQGEYIAFLDDDDLWLPDHLKNMAGFLEKNPQVSLVFSNMANYSSEGTFEKIRPNNLLTGAGKHYRELCLGGHLVSSQASLFRKEIVAKVGGMREDLSFAEDWEFFGRTAMNFEVGYINQLTCLRQVHEGSYRKPPQDTIYSLEKVLRIIEENSFKYSYPIPDSILAQKYLDIGKAFVPFNFSKLRMYILKSLKKDFSVVFRLSTWGLILRAVMDKNLYLALQKIARRWR